jgi:ArsR family transcriptional regulator
MQEISETIEILKGLGDTTRFRILQSLSQCGNNLCVSALADQLKISQPVISQHLKVLKNAGIVIANRKGYHIHYSINLDCISSLINQISIIIDISPNQCTDASCKSKYPDIS